MIPFIGDVKAPVAGLAHLLIGEFVFQDSNLGQLNYLAAKIGSWSEQERAVFEAVLQNEKAGFPAADRGGNGSFRTVRMPSRDKIPGTVWPLSIEREGERCRWN